MLACRFCISLRFSLTTRLLILLFLVSHFAVACGSDATSSEAEQQAVQQKQPAKADTLARKRTAAPQDLLSNPFMADSQQSNQLDAYFSHITADFTVDAYAIENIHQPHIADTVYTIRFGDSVLELYAPTQTGDLLLQQADIRNGGILLRSNMKVGMSQPELISKLKNYDVRITQTATEIVASNREGAPMSLHFYLKNGKVNRIRYEGYID